MKRLAVALVATLFLGACGEGRLSVDPTTTESEPTDSTLARITDTETVVPADDRPMYEGFDTDLPPHSSLVALSRVELDVYERPGDGEPLQTLDGHTILGTPTIVAVLGEIEGGWAKVMVPGRPNGSTGYIMTDDVELFVVDGRIIIDLSERSLTYLQGAEEVLVTSVAVGNQRSPTPTGVFYVTDAVVVTDETGPWGPRALGLSARSDTITEFNGGDGIIGIHGTNNPSSIGKAVSLGCVRLPNDVIEDLFALVPVGTPVEIRA